MVEFRGRGHAATPTKGPALHCRPPTRRELSLFNLSGRFLLGESSLNGRERGKTSVFFFCKFQSNRSVLSSLCVLTSCPGPSHRRVLFFRGQSLVMAAACLRSRDDYYFGSIFLVVRSSPNATLTTWIHSLTHLLTYVITPTHSHSGTHTRKR